MKTIFFDKVECKVDFLLNVIPGDQVSENYTSSQFYNADYFEIVIFKKATGTMILDQRHLTVTDGSVVFISPFQRRQWRLDPNQLDFTVLVFREDFLNDFFADKLFSFRLLYFYQLNYPLSLQISQTDIEKVVLLLGEIKEELSHPRVDSAHIIRSILYYLLMKLNRNYSEFYQIHIDQPDNSLAFEYRRLLEEHIGHYQRVSEYSAILGISRITLNKAVQAQFNVSASQLLRQRLVAEIKHNLLYNTRSVTEIAMSLHFSEPNHLMRFFKKQTGQTIKAFLHDYQNGSTTLYIGT